MGYATLRLEFGRLVGGGSGGELATITLTRPERRNAISPRMIEEMVAVLDEVEASPARVGVVTGAGTAFCSGMDLDAVRTASAQSLEQALEDSRGIARLFRRLYTYPKPLIAAVNGPALAGGCGIATLCDFTLAVPEATFGYPEVRIGFIPAIVSVFLVRQIGEKRARELLLTGRVLQADEACRFGLVSEVVRAGRLRERSEDLAAALLGASPTSLARTKHLLSHLGGADLDRDLELAVQEHARIRATANFREGLTAFLDKRKPDWRLD
jgi:methylglutaconyl-CoA hydratase